MELNYTSTVLIVVAVLVLLLFFLQVMVIVSGRDKRWKALFEPSNANYNQPNATEYEPGIKKKIKTKKKGLKETFHESDFFKRWSVKVEAWCWQGGEYTKTFDDLLSEIFKFLIFGILYGVIIFFALGNVLIAILPALVLTAMPAIMLWDKISKRRSQFRDQFPFFLKTLSFVLQNGANPTNAIIEVTDKSQPGVLKECMEDVIAAQKLNGGNFVEAFEVIKKKVKLEEVDDFINVLRNNEEKGVGIADSFLNQSEMLTRVLNNKKNKKIKSVENKILLPILMIVVGLLILVLSL